jgi:putative ATP-binding cassette transporter
LPFVVLSPEYFSGRIELGTLMQAFGASFTVLKSLAVIVDQFNGLSGFAAGIARVNALAAALDRTADGNKAVDSTTIDSREESRLALENVTLLTPDYRRTLIRNATAAVSPGKGLLIAGASGAGKSSVLRAVAGLWNAGEGRIFRPPLQEMLFLPQRPYMIRGSLREQLVYPTMAREASDEDLRDILAKVNLVDLHERFGGLDIVMDWGQLLSLGEQQRLAFARLLLTGPRYAILDEATSALDVANEARLYEQLQESGMSYVSVGHRPSLHAFHDDVLELRGAGKWRLVPAALFQAGAS